MKAFRAAAMKTVALFTAATLSGSIALAGGKRAAEKKALRAPANAQECLQYIASAEVGVSAIKESDIIDAKISKAAEAFFNLIKKFQADKVICNSKPAAYFMSSLFKYNDDSEVIRGNIRDFCDLSHPFAMCSICARWSQGVGKLPLNRAFEGCLQHANENDRVLIEKLVPYTKE